MIFSNITKAKTKVSKIGFGTMRLPIIELNGKVKVKDEEAFPLLRRAYELGVNYFDTAWTYCGEDGERALGQAVKPFRNNIYISSKLPMWYVREPSDFWHYLERALKKLDSEYIDFYHFHSVNREFWEKIKAYKLLEAAEKAKDQKLIRHISFSFHDKPELMEEIIQTDVFESVLCQYNLLNTINEKPMKLAKSRGMGVMIMGPLAGGNIARANQAFVKKFSSDINDPTELGLKFVLGNPSVDCVLSGMRNIEELEKNVQAVKEALGFHEWRQIWRKSKKFTKLLAIYCTDCQYCFVCPKNIRPSHIFKMYNNWKTWGLEDAAKESYTILQRDDWWFGNKPDECINCGACARKCPQKLDIPALLKQVDIELRELTFRK